ncbi:MAG: helix-turn-helix domain-containing protein [Clostridiales bacterium]|nr:helix-turn-helix domain-containing protein [Clostridiales bacterium]
MQGNRTALRAVEILGVLSDNPDGLTLKEIVSALGIPKTSAYDILKALAYKQMVDEINDGAIRFKIGLRTF